MKLGLPAGVPGWFGAPGTVAPVPAGLLRDGGTHQQRPRLDPEQLRDHGGFVLGLTVRSPRRANNRKSAVRLSLTLF